MNGILAIDLGKRQSVTCMYDTDTHEYTFGKVITTPAAMHDLITRLAPARVVIEVGSQAGWMHDLARSLGVEIQVANPNNEKWRWYNQRRKTDRDDALKMATMSMAGTLPMVYMPKPKVRQWRSLIEYRQAQVTRLTAVKNHIRAILDRQGLTMPAGKSGWTNQTLTYLASLARPLKEADATELWRGLLYQELEQLSHGKEALAQVEAKLDELAAADEQVALMRTIPGVGPRLAETLVAIIDDPQRFPNVKTVGCYAGLTPRQYQTGQTDRQGRISSQGNKLLRTLLVEVSWIAQRYNPWLAQVFQRVCRGTKARRKIAIVACARRLLVRAWAMMRDGAAWRDPGAGAKTRSVGQIVAA